MKTFKIIFSISALVMGAWASAGNIGEGNPGSRTCRGDNNGWNMGAGRTDEGDIAGDSGV